MSYESAMRQLKDMFPWCEEPVLAGVLAQCGTYVGQRREGGRARFFFFFSFSPLLCFILDSFRVSLLL